MRRLDVLLRVTIDIFPSSASSPVHEAVIADSKLDVLRLLAQNGKLVNAKDEFVSQADVFRIVAH